MVRGQWSGSLVSGQRGGRGTTLVNWESNLPNSGLAGGEFRGWRTERRRTGIRGRGTKSRERGAGSREAGEFWHKYAWSAKNLDGQRRRKACEGHELEFSA